MPSRLGNEQRSRRWPWPMVTPVLLVMATAAVSAAVLGCRAPRRQSLAPAVAPAGRITMRADERLCGMPSALGDTLDATVLSGSDGRRPPIDSGAHARFVVTGARGVPLAEFPTGVRLDFAAPLIDVAPGRAGTGGGGSTRTVPGRIRAFDYNFYAPNDTGVGYLCINRGVTIYFDPEGVDLPLPGT